LKTREEIKSKRSKASTPLRCAPLLAGGTARGQASLFDLLMGFFIFVVVFASVTGALNKNYKEVERNFEIDELKHSSFFALKELTETKGFPEKWETLNENDVLKLGLIERRNKISEDKLVAFSNMSYDRTKELLGLKGFDYYFTLDQGAIHIEAGLEPISQTKYLFKTTRIVEYKGSEAEIEFQLYELWE